MIGVAESRHKMLPSDFVKKLQHILKQVGTLAKKNLLSDTYQIRQKMDYDMRFKVVSYEL